MTEQVDCSVRMAAKECVIVYGELDPGLKASDIKFTEVNTAQGTVVQFTCGPMYHKSAPIPADIWTYVDKGQRANLDGTFCKWTVRKGKHATMPDLTPYFNV